MDKLTNLNNRVNKVFKNPQITFFIIMCLVLIISCYSYISSPIKNTISSILSNPVITLLIIIITLIVSYYNIVIGILLLLLAFISIYSFGNGNNFNDGTIEHFSTKNTNTDDDMNNSMDDTMDDTMDEENNNTKERYNDVDEEHITKLNNNKLENSKNNLEKKKINDNEMDDKVKNIKNVLLSTFTKFKENSNDEYKKAILENKKKIYENEKKFNSSNRNNSNTRDNFENTGKSYNTNKNKNTNTNTNKNKNKNKKDRFQTIEPRKFDPSNEEDTNFLITSEIIDDMKNRIEYNYESNKYLKKYIKHRVEEIIDINKLTDDD